MSNDYKVDIFKVLNNLSNKDVTFLEQLSDHQFKQVQPLVTMRWLTGTTNAGQVFFINELVNTKVFSLYQHPLLLFYLMTVCTSGKSQKYTWHKKHKKQSSKPHAVSVIQQYFSYNHKHAAEALPLFSKQDIIAYAEEIGWQDEQLTKLKKELRNHNVHATEKLSM